MNSLSDVVEGLQEAMQDKEKAGRFMRTIVRTEAFKVWGGFLISATIIFWMFSSGDFSFLLTLSSLVSLFSFLMVALTIESSCSAKGVSLKMMECYMLVFACRACAIIPYEGYLPFDKSGDWLYQLCEVLCFCIAGSVVFQCRQRYADSWDHNADTLNHGYLIGPAFVVALILHPHLNNAWVTDIMWAFALYLESVTVLPQLFMFMKEGRAQAHTSHFLAAQALSRIFSFIFWSSTFSELSTTNHYIKRFVGHWVVVIQLIQLIIMGDFIYHYVRCLQKGISVSEIIVSSTNV